MDYYHFTLSETYTTITALKNSKILNSMEYKQDNTNVIVWLQMILEFIHS